MNIKKILKKIGLRKKLFSLLGIILACILGVIFINSKIQYDFRFDNSEVTITKCLKNGKGKLIIPKEILGKKVTRLSIEAFRELDYEEIVIPDTVEFVGRRCFYECHRLKKITGNDNVIEYRSEAFSCCEKLTEFRISDKTKVIGDAMFLECDQLKDVYVGDGIKRIPERCFDHCIKLNSIEGMKNVEFLDERSFSFSGISNIYLSNKLLFIGCNAFYFSGLSSIEIPTEVTLVYANAFDECGSIEKITFLSENSIFNYKNIDGCSNLRYIYYPNETICIEGENIDD